MSVFHKLIKHLRRKPRFSYLIIFTKTLDELMSPYQASIPFDLEMMSTNVDEIESALRLIPAEHRFDVERRVSNGDRCFVAKYDNKVIYAMWVAFGKCYSFLLSREYPLATDECYMYSAYTLPEFRGKGLHPSVNTQLFILLNKWGITRITFFIEPNNLSAMRLPEKLGYSRSGITGYFEIFGIRRYFHWDRGIFKALKRRGYWQKR